MTHGGGVRIFYVTFSALMIFVAGENSTEPVDSSNIQEFASEWDSMTVQLCLLSCRGPPDRLQQCIAGIEFVPAERSSIVDTSGLLCKTPAEFRELS